MRARLAMRGRLCLQGRARCDIVALELGSTSDLGRLAIGDVGRPSWGLEPGLWALDRLPLAIRFRPMHDIPLALLVQIGVPGGHPALTERSADVADMCQGRVCPPDTSCHPSYRASRQLPDRHILPPPDNAPLHRCSASSAGGPPSGCASI